MNSASASPASNSNDDALRHTRARAWAFAFECYRMKKGSRPEPPTPRSIKAMIRDTPSIQDSPPGIPIVFDLRERDAKERLRQERRVWGLSATVENLGYGRAVLIVKPGGALGLAR